MQNAAYASIFSMFALGLFGGCFIVAGSGFTSTGRRGAWEVFIPPPQAYVMAAIMFALSVIAMLWLLQQAKAIRRTYIIAGAAYFGAVITIIEVLTQSQLFKTV